MQGSDDTQADDAQTMVVSDAFLGQVVEQMVTAVDDIVEAAQAGSSAAFEKLYTIYSRRIYKTILSITRNPHDAEEALQDTFLRAYRAINKFEGKSQVYTWLTRIAINSALMVLRKQRIRPHVSVAFRLDELSEAAALEVKDSAPNPEELCVQRQHQLKTLNAIRRLKPKLQAPIRMQLMDGRSVKEISQALNISEAAVKSRLCRARQQLSTSRGDLAAYAKTGRTKGKVVVNATDCNSQQT
jgi:RNA polymerase sigma-70 factor (ECF subfamily)